jgi:hypothetical protein
MISNLFGVPNNGRLYIYDHYNTYKVVTNSCNRNPEYSSYCFDTSKNVDGDIVKIFIHGYMIKFPNDVS